MAQPGDCSPSRRVVSKIRTLFREEELPFFADFRLIADFLGMKLRSLG
jgi:hypothetical protein